MFPVGVAGYFKGGGASVLAYQRTTQSVAALTWTKIIYDATIRDATGSYSNSTFSAPADGIYLFNFSVAANWADAQRGLFGFRINGAEKIRPAGFANGAATEVSLSSTTVVELKAGDLVEIYMYFSVTEDTIASSDTYTYFIAQRIA